MIFREREEGSERETSICCSTHLYIHWWIPVCALTGELNPQPSGCIGTMLPPMELPGQGPAFSILIGPYSLLTDPLPRCHFLNVGEAPRGCSVLQLTWLLEKALTVTRGQKGSEPRAFKPLGYQLHGNRKWVLSLHRICTARRLAVL